MSTALNSVQQKAGVWLRQGIAPRRLALTLALGFAIGCIPVVGIPTLVCAGLAVALRLNLPAIQAANYVAMPFQVALIVPFVRLGGWLFTSGPRLQVNAAALLHSSPLVLLTQMGRMAADCHPHRGPAHRHSHPAAAPCAGGSRRRGGRLRRSRPFELFSPW